MQRWREGPHRAFAPGMVVISFDVVKPQIRPAFGVYGVNSLVQIIPKLLCCVHLLAESSGR